MSLCCALWNAFVANVRLANDDTLPACSSDTCMLAAHTQHLATELRVFSGMLDDEMSAINIEALSDEAKAQLLVYALIGQHFAADSQNDVKQHAYLRFDSMRGSTQVVRPLCSFERTVYLSIIVLTILVLISVIVLQMLRRTARARSQRDILVTVHPETPAAGARRRVGA